MTCKYYNVDLGVFPTAIKLCFDQDGLNKILDDHHVDIQIKAFKYGSAETHYLTAGKHGLVILMFDIETYGDDRLYMNSIIAHEAYHVACRVFQNMGEKQKDIGEETMAYTIEHIFKLVSIAMDTELEKRDAGKKRGSVPKQTGKRARGSVV